MKDNEQNGNKRTISRRDFVKGVGAVTGASILAQGFLGGVVIAGQPQREGSYTPENLSEAELATLQAIMARIIPADEWGGGAVEAGAFVYVDRALGQSYSEHLSTYQEGLATLDELASEMGADSFPALDDEGQDELLTRLEAGELGEGTPGVTRQGLPLREGGAEFFGLLRQHTIEGTFGDPMYGGNLNFLGWNLLGYPGVQVYYTEEEQEINGESELNNRSAAAFGAEPVL